MKYILILCLLINTSFNYAGKKYFVTEICSRREAATEITNFHYIYVVEAKDSVEAVRKAKKYVKDKFKISNPVYTHSYELTSDKVIK